MRKYFRKYYDTIIKDGDVCSFCGLPAKYRSRDTGNYRCERSSNMCPSVRAKNTKGLKKAHVESRLSAGHFNDSRGWSKGLSLTSNDKIFTENSRHSTGFVKKRIRKDNILPYECKNCGVTDSWMNRPLVLELDHINGQRTDNRIENLRFLCPNCHSQTPTFKGRNTNNGKKTVPDDVLVELAKTYECNIRRVLIEAGLAPMGANYKRVKRLISQL